MPSDLIGFLPPEAIKIALVLVLSFFIGLEREEHKQRDATYAFGGVRTFPLIGLVSFALALVSDPGLVPWALGFVVLGAFMVVSYLHKTKTSEAAGITSEISALATYLVGALVYRGQFWIAGTIAVLSLLLLELKEALEGLTQRVEPSEILTAAKFLVLTVVILPIVPNQGFSRFQINPFKTWLVVVAVSGMSFGSYLVQKVLQDRVGIMLSALLGGAYSSTVTTVILAKRSKDEPRAGLFSGSILAASGVMYARLVILVAFFSRAIAAKLAPGFVALAIVGVLGGWLVCGRGDRRESHDKAQRLPRNPLELKAAFFLAAVFVVMVVLTGLVRDYLGRFGIYVLGVVLGAVDVDPFILGLAQAKSTVIPVEVATSAIIIAAASNNLAKGVYAFCLADRRTGRRSLILLAGLALLGLVPLAWN